MRLKCLVVGALACALAVIAPAAASATTVFVSNTGVVEPPFNTCEHPGYNTIQAAVNVNTPTPTIHVCRGTYKEQVVISKALILVGEAGLTKLAVPASPSNSTTSCDIQEPGYEQQDLLTICEAGEVKASNLTIEGRWPAGPNCAQQYFAVMIGGGSKLSLSKSEVSHAGAEPLNGCQQGIGVQVGHNRNAQVGLALLSSDVITGYQKNGITVDGPGSSATIKGNEISTAPTAEIAQTGIQVSRGAFAKISGAKIKGNECNVSPACGFNEFGFAPWQEEEDATGILFYLAGKGSSVKGSTISGNDIGIYHMTREGATSKAQTQISSNTLTENRYWAIALDQGFAMVSKNTISKGDVGIQIVQYDEEHQGLEKQQFGPKGTGNEDAVTEMSVCGVEGLSDNGANDQFGSLSLTASMAKFSGNTANVCNNNTTGKLVISVG